MRAQNAEKHTAASNCMALRYPSPRHGIAWLDGHRRWWELRSIQPNLNDMVGLCSLTRKQHDRTLFFRSRLNIRARIPETNKPNARKAATFILVIICSIKNSKVSAAFDSLTSELLLPGCNAKEWVTVERYAFINLSDQWETGFPD